MNPVQRVLQRIFAIFTWHSRLTIQLAMTLAGVPIWYSITNLLFLTRQKSPISSEHRLIQVKEGKNTLRWDKTSCHRFSANEARLKMGFLACNLLHLMRQFYLWGEDKRRSIEWIINRIVKAGARIACHARHWYVHVASAFPLAHHYRAVLGWQN